MTRARSPFPLCALLALAPCAAAQAGFPADRRADLPPGAPPGIELINREDLLAHATFLASDDLGGRLTGSPGQLEAAHYIAERFERMGLEPLGDDDGQGGRSWFQSYGVVRTAIDLEATALVLDGEDLGDRFGVLPAAELRDVAVQGPWVYVDIREEVPDLTGAIPVVLLRTPPLRARDINVVFSSALRSFLRARGIAHRLAKQGAEVAVFCQLDDDGGVVTALNYVGLSPGKDLLQLDGDGGMAAMAENFKSPVPHVFLSAATSRRVLAALGVQLDEGGRRAVPAPDARTVPGELRLRTVVDPDARAVNVVGCLRGAGPELADEAVLYTAHMDHVGRRLDGEVFNGADDNASGTAGLLEIAQAYAGAGERPRRSVVLLAVSGEELGLWGSGHFATHPTWPLDKIVANVNTDMIGRTGPESGPDEVTVTPSYRHGMFSSIVRDSAAIAEALGLSFQNGDKYYTRSDHFNFASRGIPVVFFCNGEHEDYHQVTDHADKLDIEKMERVARLAYWTGRHVADDPSRPQRLGRCRDWDGTPR